MQRGSETPSTSNQRRLRDGKSFVASAPQAFADPSAFISRYTKSLGRVFWLRLS